MSFKFNPFYGTFDLVGSGDTVVGEDNFSYVLVSSGVEVTIPEEQLMLIDGEMVVDGTLIVDGKITDIVDYGLWGFGFNRIIATQTIKVPLYRDLLAAPGIEVDGILAIDGRLYEV